MIPKWLIRIKMTYEQFCKKTRHIANTTQKGQSEGTDQHQRVAHQPLLMSKLVLVTSSIICLHEWLIIQ